MFFSYDPNHNHFMSNDRTHHARMSLKRRTFNMFVYKDNLKLLHNVRVSTPNPYFYYVSISTAAIYE